MNWKGISKNCMSSEEGYLLSRYALQSGYGYVCRCPKGKIVFSSDNQDAAKAACVEHLNNQKVGKAA